MSDETNANEIREAVRQRYASAAREAQSQQRASCGCDSGPNVSQSQTYDISQIEDLPDKAVLASLGRGNHQPEGAGAALDTFSVDRQSLGQISGSQLAYWAGEVALCGNPTC